MELEKYKGKLFMSGIVLAVSLTVLALSVAYSEWKSLSHPNGQVATITVAGDGEVTAKPDISKISFTVDEVAKTVSLAQSMSEDKIKATVSKLKDLGIDEKDIKTTSYSINPKYSYNSYCLVPEGCGSKQKLDGYEVMQGVEVKVRDTTKVGDVFALLGTENITNVYGPSFEIENPDNLKAQAREKAIVNAKEKAQKLASDLGVSLGEISQYSENNNNYYPAVMSMGAVSNKGLGGAQQDVTVPTGENSVKIDVSITYFLK